MRMRPFAIASIVAFASLAADEARAFADEKEACVAASDQAQTLRDEGKFHAARVQMLACARETCPTLVRHDCDKYLAELDTNQPSVVLGARDPKGNDIRGTRVSMDGVALVDHLDGKPIPIDPGEHTFRYETMGAAPVEQHAIIRVGERNRILTAIVMPLSSPGLDTRSQPLAPVELAPPRPEAASHTRVPVVPIVLASVAVVAGASFAYFGLRAQSDVSALRTTCAPNCAQGDVDAARTKLVVADVSLGVGVVSLAAAAWFFFRRPQTASPPPVVEANLQPRPGGGFASLTAHF